MNQDSRQPIRGKNPSYFSFKGRIGRLDLFIRTLTITLCLYASKLLMYEIMAHFSISDYLLIYMVMLSSLLIGFVAYIASIVKRAHDMEWPGIAVIIGLIPVLNLIFIFWKGGGSKNKHTLD